MYMKNNLKRIREERKISLRELERKAKVNKTSISLIEDGYSDPRFSTVIKICKALNLRIEDIFPY